MLRVSWAFEIGERDGTPGHVHMEHAKSNRSQHYYDDYIYLFLLLSTVGAFQPNIATCILLDPYLTGLTHYYCRSNSPEAGLPGSGSGVFFMFMFTS